MLQELASGSGATGWAIGSLLFFIAAYILIVVRLYQARPEDLAAHARMALDDDEKA
ncbi:MAG: hypothetical protein WC815_18715 [Vicinamibacterales bacterium]|jgi:uncharacterized membrane protein